MRINILGILLFSMLAFSCKKSNKEGVIGVENQSPIVDSISKTDLQDSVKKESHINPIVNQGNSDGKLLLEFYKNNEQKPQLFVINNKKDTTIVCNQKTRITINAQSFVSENTGKDILDEVQILVSEYYKTSDILLARLSTTTNGKMLETAGMLNVKAQSKEGICRLKKGRTIEIEFPRKEEKKNMQLYTGLWTEDIINWQVQENTADLNQVFSVVDAKPVFPGGIEKLYSYISSRIIIPDESVSGTVYATFVIDKEGAVTNVKINRGLGKEIDGEVIRVLRTIPKFIPGKINGKPVRFTYGLPVHIYVAEVVESNSLATQRLSKKQFEERYTDENKLQKAGVDNVGYYLFSSSKLGFINCDRLWQSNTMPGIAYALDLDANSQTSVNIVFHDVKSIMNGFSETKRLSFNNIPSNENITIFAIKSFDKKLFLATKETKTSAVVVSDLVYKPVTMDILKSEMKKLDRFN